jgi:hypothetical protein
VVTLARRTLLGIAGAAALSSAAFAMSRAAEPVRHVRIHVQPYYEAARAPGGTPLVAVGASFEGLASNRREDILAVRDKIVADPRLITPMTLMVLAIRLYDVGRRDDAVFWFYAARDRYLILDAVVDVDAGGLVQVEEAVRSFSTLAGPFINGYAFCDVANQQAIRAKALDWVEANPYEAIFMDHLPAKANTNDRGAALRDAVASARAAAAKESAYLGDPKNVAQLKADRARTQMDVKFCWKS